MKDVHNWGGCAYVEQGVFGISLSLLNFYGNIKLLQTKKTKHLLKIPKSFIKSSMQIKLKLNFEIDYHPHDEWSSWVNTMSLPQWVNIAVHITQLTICHWVNPSIPWSKWTSSLCHWFSRFSSELIHNTNSKKKMLPYNFTRSRRICVRLLRSSSSAVFKRS